MFRRTQSIFDTTGTGCNRQRFKYIKKCSCSNTDSKSQDDKNAKKNTKQKSKSRTRKSCKVVSKLLIPEDLMFEILSLVPVHCLINSARYVCKPWATTIGSSLFAEVCLHRGAHSKPGLYVEHCDSRASYFLDIINNVNGQFERTDLGIPPKMGRIVGSCDGILLLCNCLYQLFVVNPILKCWLRIPPLSISKNCTFTIARVPHTTMFKMFFIDTLEVSGAFWYVFYVLRIGIDNSLKEIARKKDPLYWFREPLYIGGNDLYYITTKGITVVDVDKEIIVGEYPLPPVDVYDYYQKPIWLSMGGHLSCIVPKGILHHITYEIYILDIDSGKWSLYHETEPFNFAAACGHETIIQNAVVRLLINDQMIIQVYIEKKEVIRSRSIHFSYNVKTRRLKKIAGIPKGDVRVWLHTNSLVSLPDTSTRG